MRQILAEGKYLRLVKQGQYEFVERTHKGGVAVLVAVTQNQEIVLVEQHRVSLNSRTIELPAGLVGDLCEDEKIEDAAKRELIEETGFEASSLEKIGYWPSSSGTSAEMLTIFYASELKKVSQGGGVESENIKVHVVPLMRAHDWLEQQSRNEILIDSKLYSGLYIAHYKLNLALCNASLSIQT